MIYAPSHHDLILQGGVLSPGPEGTREIAVRGQNHWQNTCLEPDRNVDAEPRSHHSTTGQPNHS